MHPYQVTAAQLATSIDSRRQHYLLSERGQQIAVLKERQRLARDLHDSVTQLIFSMTLIAQSIAPAWRRDSAEGERRVNRLLELSQAALAEMRALLAELRPPDLPPWPVGSQPSCPSRDYAVQQEGLWPRCKAMQFTWAGMGCRSSFIAPIMCDSRSTWKKRLPHCPGSLE
ncbi:MAG: hypothetical protein HS126_20180 [Anaerolineales bacterium]|nr:hypothetical protein [Anaerolineales bacterium]